MGIVAARVDERLVHGQIMTSWSQYLQLKTIVVVDDQVAADDFMKTVLSMSAPTGITIEIVTVTEAARGVADGSYAGNTMLLFKRIGAALDLARALEGTPDALHELNLGNLGSIPGRTQLSKNVWLSNDERAQVRELAGLGVEVYLQMLHTDTRVGVDGL